MELGAAASMVRIEKVLKYLNLSHIKQTLNIYITYIYLQLHY